MPKNVMKLLKPSPHRARNDFDLSHRHVYDANFGELLPSTCIETVPGDHIVLHASDLLRANTMVTSPFLRAKQHLDVWFVPYKDLWHNFDNFITKRDQPVSSALKGSAYCPHFSVYDLKLRISNMTSSDVDIVGKRCDDGAERLLELLGYGFNFKQAPAEAQANYPKLNAWRLLAYNYIWYNEYRQKYYDDGTYRMSNGSTAADAAKLFNCDLMQCDSLANADIAYSSMELTAMLQMRYRTWKKDLFTGVLPSTQFGNVSIQYAIGQWSKLVLTNNEPNAVNVAAKHNGFGQLAADGIANSSVYTASYNGSPVIPSQFDVLSLRKSEAVQVWRENALRAGNRTSDNMMAHYGVESDFRDHRPTYLGSVSAPLNIGDVMATANSSSGINDTVGDVAGKGLSSLDEKVFTFDAKDFGVIMVIHSILPEAEYNATGVERMNQLLEAEDYFVPEFENLGLEGVGIGNFMQLGQFSGLVFGYAPRYYGYKTKVDKCFGSFMNNGPSMTNINSSWCSPRYDVSQILINLAQTGSFAMPLQCLYVNPDVFDVNFVTANATVPQFKCDVYFDVDAVRPMSVTGLPFS